MIKNWGMDLVRSFFAAIDKAIYSFIATIYQIILELADVTILSSDAIQDVYSRIYALLAIFMLFKITFSFVNYVINPDQFTDKQKGVQNLIKNVILVLVMIIITPFAFGKLQEAQSAILDDDLIPRFIVGGTGDNNTTYLENQFSMSDSCENLSTTGSDGDFLALVTFRPFYQLEPNITHDSNFSDLYCTKNSTRVTISHYLKEGIYNDSTGDVYIVDYKFFLSTIVGIFVCLILISFCFDIAVRTIKLAFLQMIAPIPILSYIDPASSKNGMFTKWIKQIASTWASLFIRLIAIFFAVLVISKINIELIKTQVEGGHEFCVMLFILIGALMFAKQLPKLLEELIPGLKLGGMQLNPFKKVSDQALGGKQLLGLGAAGLGFGAASISNLGAHIKDKSDQRKDEENLQNAQNSYNRFKAYADSMKATKGWSEAKYNNYLSQKYNQKGGVKDMAEKLAENQAKRMERFSFTHPIRANISQSLSGARLAYNQGKNGKLDLFDVARKADKIKDYKDTYSTRERINQKASDFFGIQNDSGTASIIADDIKKKEESLIRINRGIEMLNRSFSDLATRMGPTEFAKALSMNADGKYELNANYNNATYLNEIKAILTQMNTAEGQRLATTKEIKRLQKLKDKTPGDKPK